MREMTSKIDAKASIKAESAISTIRPIFNGKLRVILQLRLANYFIP